METQSETYQNKNHSKEKLLNGAIIAIAAISLFVASSCKVMLPNGQIMSRSDYLAKRDKARKKCDKLLPEHLRKKEFEDIYCNPCTLKFKACIDKEFK